jgi:hypothetical protein
MIKGVQFAVDVIRPLHSSAERPYFGRITGKQEIILSLPVCRQVVLHRSHQDHPKGSLSRIVECLYGRGLVMASSQFTIAACIAIR